MRKAISHFMMKLGFVDMSTHLYLMERMWNIGRTDAERDLSVSMVHPSLYDDGYMDALRDILDDECTNPSVVEAREWMDKKARRAHS